MLMHLLSELVPTTTTRKRGLHEAFQRTTSSRGRGDRGGAFSSNLRGYNVVGAFGRCGGAFPYSLEGIENVQRINEIVQCSLDVEMAAPYLLLEGIVDGVKTCS